ncbi:MAG: cyclic nucleotide-binding and patatin-like phospholipase domain-containing protein [Planctomycetota bacterium]
MLDVANPETDSVEMTCRTSELTSTLRQVLPDLAEATIADIAERCEPRHYESGHEIIRAGDEPTEIQFVISGKTRVWTTGTDSRTMMLLGPGEHFGAVSVLDRSPHRQTITALTAVDTLSVSATDLLELCDKHPKISQLLCRNLSRRLQILGQRASQGRSANRRKIHSLAIICDGDRATQAAIEFVYRLIQFDGHITVAEVVAEGHSCRTGHASWEAVKKSNLGQHVAQHAATNEVCIVVARDPSCSMEAIGQCDRVVFFRDHARSQSWIESATRENTKPRTIVANLIDRSSQQEARCETNNCTSVMIRVDNSAKTFSKTDSADIERLRRTLIGCRIGLALGGGGARGIAHIGVLKTLQQAGVVFDTVAGTSAGAIVGAAFAAGIEMDELQETFRREFVPPRWMAATAFGRRLYMLGAFRGPRINQILRRSLHDRRFEDLALPFASTSVDLIRGETVIHRTGDLVEGVRASINHPVFGKPILRDDQALVDGGILMNVPASALAEEDCDAIISVDVGAELPSGFGRDARRGLRAPSYLATILRTIDVAQHHSTFMHRSGSGLIIKPKTAEFRLEDFHEVDELVARGRDAAQAQLDDVVAKVRSITKPRQSVS